jgi:hypothetical protein
VIVEATGKVERSVAGESAHWEIVHDGARLQRGEHVRTQAASFAQVSLRAGARLTLEPESELRFLEGLDATGEAWEILSGRGVLETPSFGHRVRSSFGQIVTKEGTRVELSGRPNAMFVLVQTGHARIESRTGTVLELAPTEGVELTRNGTRVVLASGPPSEAPPPAPPTEDEIRLEAGHSLVIHDPKGQAPVRFLFGAGCPEGSVQLQAEGSAPPRASEWSSHGSAVLRVEPGTFEYRLQCRASPNESLRDHSQGTVTVLNDDGEKPLDARPDAATIDVNGRQYTVLFHGGPPQVTFRWPDAPPAPRYMLALTFQGRTRKVYGRQPVYGFAAGELGEGTYQAQFSAKGIASDRSVVAVRFDTSTRIVSLNLNSPQVTARALEGWSLEYRGASLPKGPDGGFSFSIEPGTPHATLWARYPGRTPHVYLLASESGSPRMGRPSPDGLAP